MTIQATDFHGQVVEKLTYNRTYSEAIIIIIILNSHYDHYPSIHTYYVQLVLSK